MGLSNLPFPLARAVYLSVPAKIRISLVGVISPSCRQFWAVTVTLAYGFAAGSYATPDGHDMIRSSLGWLPASARLGLGGCA